MQEISQLSASDMCAYDFLSHPVLLFEIRTLNILASNSAAQRWLGYDAATLHALTVADICPKDEQPHIAGRVHKFEATHTEVESWILCTSTTLADFLLCVLRRAFHNEGSVVVEVWRRR